jgi:hypothetical protein
MEARPGGTRAPIIRTGDSASTLAQLVSDDFGHDAVHETLVGCLSHQVCLSGWLGQPFVFVDAASDPGKNMTDIVDELSRTDCPVMDGCMAVIVSNMSGSPTLTRDDINNVFCGDGNTSYSRFHPYAVPRP